MAQIADSLREMSDLNIIFCPDELLSQIKKPLNLPLHGGPKAFAPDENSVEDELLTSMLVEQKNVLKEQRIHKRGNLSVATWNPEEHVVEVSVAKGSYWQHFGQRKGSKMLLKPHEALFLLEQGSLELFYGGLPMSFQQGYMSLLSEDFTPDHYQVYAYFLRLGFTVLQHSSRPKSSPGSSRKDPVQEEMGQSVETSSEASSDDCVSSNKPVISSPVSHLWNSEDGVTPLVRPEDATSTAALLSKMQVIKNQRMTDTDSAKNSDQRSLQVAFDVYQPGVNFKKTDPGPPHFCITVCRYYDPPPSLAALSFLTKQCSPVPLKIALVDGGNISFYSVLDVDSPTFITRG